MNDLGRQSEERTGPLTATIFTSYVFFLFLLARVDYILHARYCDGRLRNVGGKNTFTMVMWSRSEYPGLLDVGKRSIQGTDQNP